jgi:hypothetical protein
MIWDRVTVGRLRVARRSQARSLLKSINNGKGISPPLPYGPLRGLLSPLPQAALFRIN